MLSLTQSKVILNNWKKNIDKSYFGENWNWGGIKGLILSDQLNFQNENYLYITDIIKNTP